MTIRIGEFQTEIEPHDTLRLQAMAASVLANRPSFRTLHAWIQGEPVDIYTRFDRRGGEELFVVEGTGRHMVLRPSDREALGAIARRAA
jgi:hypothetical protein